MKPLLKYLGIIVLLCVASCWVGDCLYPLQLQRYQDTSTVIANHQPLHIFYTKDDKWRILTNTDDVNELYLKTLLAREDKFFRTHIGINPFALVRAFYQWVKNGRVISGGSTLTMQTARLLEPRKRHIGSKMIECFRALQLEWHFSKNEILNIYMTLAPFGGNIEGVNAASWAYFKKSASMLNPSEIAFLVAIVQSPKRFNPDKFPVQALDARKAILQFMRKKGFISESLFELSNLAPLPIKSKPPRQIPHLALHLKKQYPSKRTITTTIDHNLQKQAEHLLRMYTPFLPDEANAAILILDHVQNKPLVYIGSRDFLDSEHHGFVDYIQAYRSPGSTLKSLIYGFAFDLGIISPDCYINDDYRRFGAYAPRNYTKDVQGVVKVKDALASSLNIPAVMLLNQIGVLRFIGKLKEAGIYPKFPKGFESPSLPVALGGLGMTLEQLIQLYAALANQGKLREISYHQAGTDSFHPILSNHAAAQVTEILTRNSLDGHEIAFKTGTSYGHRDALVIGYDKQYVVGIWAGSHDSATLSLSGSHLIPLLQRIFKVLPSAQEFTQRTFKAHPSFQLQDLSSSSFSENTLQTPSLIFPISESVIEKNDKDTFQLPLTVSGGKRPYTWLVDGEPIATQCWQKKFFWIPPKSGFYCITVIDAQGKSAQASIELR